MIFILYVIFCIGIEIVLAEEKNLYFMFEIGFNYYYSRQMLEELIESEKVYIEELKGVLQVYIFV